MTVMNTCRITFFLTTVVLVACGGVPEDVVPVSFDRGSCVH